MEGVEMNRGEKLISEGKFNINTKKYDVNTSNVFSEILRSLRYCDIYLSDVLYGIERVRTLVDNGVSGVVWFGFYADGVDYENYIMENMMDERYRYHYYRDLIRVEVTVIERTGSVEIVLEHSGYSQFMKELRITK